MSSTYFCNVMCINSFLIVNSVLIILTYTKLHMKNIHTCMCTCTCSMYVLPWYHTYIHKLHTYITYILMCVWTDPIVHIHVVCSISVYTCTTVNEM